MSDLTQVENRLMKIEAKQENVASQLERLADAVNNIAVQNERIDNVEEKINVLLSKWDKLADPEHGILMELKTFKAQCPKETLESKIKWVWMAVLPMGISMILCSIAMIRLLITCYDFLGK